MMLRFWLSSLFVLFFIVCHLSLCHAEAVGILQQEYSAKKKKLESIENRLRKKRAAKRKIEKKQQDVLKEIEELDKRISEQWKRLEEARKRWTEAELEFENIKDELNKTVKKTSLLKKYIEERLRAFRQMGEIGILNVFFAADSIPDLLARQYYLKMVLEEDQRRRKQYKELLRELREKEDNFKDRQASFKTMTARLEKETKILEERKQEKREYLARLKSKEKSYRRMISQLDRARKRLKQVVDELALKAHSEQAALKHTTEQDQFSFSAQKGRLNLPVMGKVVLFKSRKSVPGMVIECPWGSQIRAIFDGKVVYNDSLPGYGRVFIMDHGDGYMSLVAQGQSFSKPVGAEVAEGEVVGLSGGGPWSAEGIYVEIRKDGKKVSPTSWFDLRGIEIVYR